MPDPDIGVDLQVMHAAIIAGLAATFPALSTVADYPHKTVSLDVPAAFLNFMGAEPADDLGTDQLELETRWELVLVVSFRQTDAKRYIRWLATQVARHIFQQRWGQAVGPARIQAIEPEPFRPDLDRYESWRIEWTQAAAIGPSVWAGDDILPDTVIVQVNIADVLAEEITITEPEA